MKWMKSVRTDTQSNLLKQKEKKNVHLENKKKKSSFIQQPAKWMPNLI